MEIAYSLCMRFVAARGGMREARGDGTSGGGVQGDGWSYGSDQDGPGSVGEGDGRGKLEGRERGPILGAGWRGRHPIDRDGGKDRC